MVLGDRLIGRTRDFDSRYRGSSPCLPAIVKGFCYASNLPRQRKFITPS